MTHIDFYVLTNITTFEHGLEFACRVVNKAFRQGHGVYVHAGDEMQAHRLDQLLWQHPKESFIPHNLLEKGPAPVNIGYENDSGAHADVMLNLNSTVPSFFSRFTRVIELVLAEPEHKRISREHYSFYKNQGFPLKSHTIGQQ
ncbi:MAG: DNA polymerase III subunit chi [Pseudomonadales bacterium]